MNIKEILLKTTWGQAIDCEAIDPQLNGGMGAYPTFKNEELMNVINYTLKLEIFKLLREDKEVQDHFINIGHKNFIKEESERDDFKDMIRGIFGFNTKEEYLEMSDEEYFKEMFLEVQDDNYIYETEVGTFFWFEKVGA